MNMKRTSLLLAGLFAGAALGIGSTFVWLKRPGWLPFVGTSGAQDRSANHEHDPADAAHGPADDRQDA